MNIEDFKKFEVNNINTITGGTIGGPLGGMAGSAVSISEDPHPWA